MQMEIKPIGMNTNTLLNIHTNTQVSTKVLHSSKQITIRLHKEHEQIIKMLRKAICNKFSQKTSLNDDW